MWLFGARGTVQCAVREYVGFQHRLDFEIDDGQRAVGIAHGNLVPTVTPPHFKDAAAAAMCLHQLTGLLISHVLNVLRIKHAMENAENH